MRLLFLFSFFALCSYGETPAEKSPAQEKPPVAPAAESTPEKKDTEKPKAEKKESTEENEPEYKIPDGKSIPKAVKIDENRVRIGEVTVNKKDRSFSIDTQMNMREGLIEYLVSMPHGKLHEALLITLADPFHMSIACKLLDFPVFHGLFPERDENLEWKPWTEPKREQFQGSLVEITASWKQDGKELSMPASQLIKYKNTEQKLAANEWVLVDSIIYKKVYQGSLIGDIVAIYGDGNALISYSGFANDGENVWLANTKLLPPSGTPITLTFKKLPKAEADKPVSARPKDDISTPEATHYLD